MLRSVDGEKYYQRADAGGLDDVGSTRDLRPLVLLWLPGFGLASTTTSRLPELRIAAHVR